MGKVVRGTDETFGGRWTLKRARVAEMPAAARRLLHIRYDRPPFAATRNQNRAGPWSNESSLSIPSRFRAAWGATMSDLSVRLRDNPHLLSLLSHYARLGAEDRTTWRDRLMRTDGVGAEQLTVLHGELIAFDGIEQNTGHAVLGPDGALSACYRITQNGLREYRCFQGVEAAEEQPEPTVKPSPRFPLKKKERPASEAVAASE